MFKKKTYNFTSFQLWVMCRSGNTFAPTGFGPGGEIWCLAVRDCFWPSQWHAVFGWNFGGFSEQRHASWKNKISLSDKHRIIYIYNIIIYIYIYKDTSCAMTCRSEISVLKWSFYAQLLLFHPRSDSSGNLFLSCRGLGHQYPNPKVINMETSCWWWNQNYLHWDHETEEQTKTRRKNGACCFTSTGGINGLSSRSSAFREPSSMESVSFSLRFVRILWATYETRTAGLENHIFWQQQSHNREKKNERLIYCLDWIWTETVQPKRPKGGPNPFPLRASQIGESSHLFMK